MDTAALDQAIADLENLLNTGAETVTVDGQTTRFNLNAARDRLRDLKRLRYGRGQVRHIRLDGGFPNY